MATCNACGLDAEPVMALGANNKIGPQCPKCEAPMYSAPPPPPANRPQARPVVAAPAPTQSAPMAPGDVVGMVRARLAFLETEIAKMKGLEVEAKQLRKMLSAAERVVRETAALGNVAGLLAQTEIRN